VNGSTISLTARTTGSSTNYSLSVSSATSNPQYFSSPSFTLGESGSSLTGGSNGSTSYDTGTITASVNGVYASANWGQGSTANTVASALASAIQNAAGSFLNASSNGGVVTLTSTSSGYWSISVSVNDTNPNFSSASFSATSSGMNPAGYTAETAYSYNIGYDGVNNTTSLTDSVMGTWNYSYGTLNRLSATLQVSGGLYNGLYGCWTYDGFGDRTMEAVSGTPCANSPTPTSWAHYNASNQITGTGQMPTGDDYDAAGDVTNDGTNAYLYDGAGRICAAENLSTGGLTGYIYDGEGNRVAKGSLSSFSCNLSSNGFSIANAYTLGFGGEQLTETNGAGHFYHTNVFAGGALLATYGGSDTYFALTDWQGTKRAETGVGGCLSTWSSLPFGNSLTPSGNCPDATEHHYTGKIHDSETGNDDFGARYYASTAARWLSPDWAAAAEAVPYASFTSPQTLNLYAFVGNNPLSDVDPDGHEAGRVLCSDGVAGQCGVGTCPGCGEIFSSDTLNTTPDPTDAEVQAEHNAQDQLTHMSRQAIIRASKQFHFDAVDFEETVVAAGSNAQVDPNVLVGLGYRESSLNPSAENGGLYQLQGSMLKDLGISSKDIDNYHVQIPGVAGKMASNISYFSGSLDLGIAAWTLGTHGTEKLLNFGGMRSVRSALLSRAHPEYGEVGEDYIDMIESFVEDGR